MGAHRCSLSLIKPEELTNAFAFSWFNGACTVDRGYSTHLWCPTAWKHQRRVQDSTDAGGCLRSTKTSKQQYSAEVATATPLQRKASGRAPFSDRLNCSPRMLRLQMSTRGTWRCHANNSILSRASILVHRPERRSEWLRQSHFQPHVQLDSRHQTNMSRHQLLMPNSIRTKMDHE